MHDPYAWRSTVDLFPDVEHREAPPMGQTARRMPLAYAAVTAALARRCQPSALRGALMSRHGIDRLAEAWTTDDAKIAATLNAVKP